MSNFFRGTNQEQDIRYKDKMKKLRKTMSFPSCYKDRVDMEKVQLAVVKPWISHRVTQILGIPDEVVIGLVFNLLEAKKNPDPKDMQIQLTGFLEGKTKGFMAELWPMLVSASRNPTGIPKDILDAKKAEILAKYNEKKRLAAAIAKKQESLKARGERDGERPRNSRWDRDKGRSRNDRSSRRRDRDTNRDRSRSRDRKKDREGGRERGNGRGRDKDDDRD
eukprot:CAMPEP_0114492892 /NCGR_PEP_ID=MMETSP0109-20121206/3810_1 /TAXON_ID=29199 /ORGANISM="Chlorarachnion reptans, Strain CCCM449" /LENGTH=220 /DNA_ID=CAMNT_0001669791 /DNA_START=14 /DNA_END=676 /DNA_ORIENTATION=-